MKKSKLPSILRLFAAFPLILRREWASFLLVSGPMGLAIGAMFPVAIIVVNPFFRWFGWDDFLGMLGRAVIAGAVIGGTIVLPWHLFSVIGFYGRRILKLYLGTAWTARDFRKFHLLVEQLEFEPIFPTWVYWQQLRFQVWYASKRRSLLRSVSLFARLSQKL